MRWLGSRVMAPGVMVALVSGQSSAGAQEFPSRFIRFNQKDLEGRLETAEVSFTSSATRCEVTLVGVIHIADRGYYQEVQRGLEAYDAVFFEGVTGAFEPVDQAIEIAVNRQDQAGIVGNAQIVARNRDALPLEPLDLLGQRMRIDNDTVANHRQLAGARNTGG